MAHESSIEISIYVLRVEANSFAEVGYRVVIILLAVPFIASIENRGNERGGKKSLVNVVLIQLLGAVRDRYCRRVTRPAPARPVLGEHC